jgi:hypothetical protein
MNAPELLELNRRLAQWRLRELTRQGLEAGTRGICLGLMAGIAIAFLAIPNGHLSPGNYWSLVLVLPLIIGITCGVSAAMKVPNGLQAARMFDHRLNLAERTSTALEMAGSPASNNPLLQMQLEDALHATERVQRKHDLSLYPGRKTLLAVAILVSIAIALPYWGRPYFDRIVQKEVLKQKIVQQAAQVEVIRSNLDQNNRLSDAQKQIAAATLERARQEIEQAQTPEQAFTAMQSAIDQLQDQASPALLEKLKALQKAGDLLDQSQSDRLQALAHAMSQGDFNRAADLLQDMDSAQLSAAETQAITQMLENAAQSLGNLDPDLASQLNSAAQALREASSSSDENGKRQALEAAADAFRQADEELAQAIALAETIGSLQAGQAQLAQGDSVPGDASGDRALIIKKTTGGAGAGRGSGPEITTPGPEAPPAPISQNNGPGDAGESDYQPVYAPQRLGGEGGNPQALPASGEPGDKVVGLNNNTPAGQVNPQVPYSQVYPAYWQTFRQAMQNGQVPDHLRAFVRQYFIGLQP